MLLRRVLLGFSVLTSAAVAAVAGFTACLFSEGYSSGGDPQSVTPLAFPLSLLVLLVAGLPATLACAATWAGYFAVARVRGAIAVSGFGPQSSTPGLR